MASPSAGISSVLLGLKIGEERVDYQLEICQQTLVGEVKCSRSQGSSQSLVKALVVVALYQDHSAHIAFKTRAFSRSNFARPNICLLIYLSLFTCPSV